jgi:hypothetical protein
MTDLDPQLKLRLVIALVIAGGALWAVDAAAWSQESLLCGLTAALALCGFPAAVVCVVAEWPGTGARFRAGAVATALSWCVCVVAACAWLPGAWAHAEGRPVAGRIVEVRRQYYTRRHGPPQYEVTYTFSVGGMERQGKQLLHGPELTGLAAGSPAEVRYVENVPMASALAVSRGIDDRGMAGVQAAAALPLLYLCARRWRWKPVREPLKDEDEDDADPAPAGA